MLPEFHLGGGGFFAREPMAVDKVSVAPLGWYGCVPLSVKHASACTPVCFLFIRVVMVFVPKRGR